MIYTIENLIQSIAAQLSGRFPEYPVYDSSNQQDTAFPCFFIFLMPSGINDQIDRIEKRDIAFDVVFVQQRNIPNANAQIYGIADELDDLMDMVYYTADDETVPLHTHERTWSIEDQELHYKLHVKQRVSHGREHNPMYRIEELNVNILRSGQNYRQASGTIALPLVNQITVVTEITEEDMLNAIPGDVLFGGAVASTFLQNLTGEDITNVSGGNMNFGGAAGITVLNAVGG